jgi:hypothetical protein
MSKVYAFKVGETVYKYSKKAYPAGSKKHSQDGPMKIVARFLDQNTGVKKYVVETAVGGLEFRQEGGLTNKLEKEIGWITVVDGQPVVVYEKPQCMANVITVMGVL